MTTIVNPRRVNAGTFGPSPAQTIAAAPQDRALVLQLLSDDWTTNEIGLEVDLVIELSVDGGQTWQPAAAIHAIGGAVNARTGALPSVSVALPANQAVQLRGTATLNQRANSLGLAYDIA